MANESNGRGGNAPVLRVKKKDGRVTLPRYESSGAAGMDLKAFIEAELMIPPLGRLRVPTGLFVEIPPGYEAQLRPRSGLAEKLGITILNAPGTIDSDYRGELEVILVNLGAEPFTLKNGDRIAQMVVAPVTRPSICEAEFLSETERGSGGFGSTGS
jgi:dUTP pyrophosphatase